MIAGELRTMAMHELRDKARLGIAYAQAGTPVMIFQHGEPSAVLVAAEEVERWVAIERAIRLTTRRACPPAWSADGRPAMRSTGGSWTAAGHQP